MFEKAYMCTNNHILKEIVTDISVSWTAKYIGRRILPEKYYELFDHNGYDFENDQYDMNGIMANIKPTVDSNGFITGISSYKVKYYSDGPRPHTGHKELSKRDINHFSMILDSVTEDNTILQYNELVSMLKKGDVLANGFIIKGVAANGITLVSPDGAEKKLTRKNILSVLIISHTFLDVLTNPDIMKEFPDIILEDEIPFYLALLSIVDYSSYHNSSKLIEEASNRNLLRDAITGYPALVSAVENNDSSSIDDLIKFAPLVIINEKHTHEPPIIIAVRNNNYRITERLLKGGAYSKEAYLDESNTSISPLRIAIENKNYDLIALLCQYYGATEDSIDTSCFTWFPLPQASFKMSEILALLAKAQDYQALRIILPFVARGTKKTSFDPLLFPNLKESDIEFFISIPNASINWPLSMVKQIYTVDRTKCLQMVSQGCEIEAVDFFINENDYELFRIALSHHKLYHSRESFNSAFERGGDWYKTLEKAYSSEFNFKQDRDIFLRRLIEAEKYDAAKNAVAAMGIPIPIKPLDAFINYPSEKSKTQKAQDFFKYIVDNCTYTENIGDGSVVDSSFHFFTDALISFADTAIVKEFMDKYPLRITHNDECFQKEFFNMIVHRTDDLFVELLKKRLAYDESRTPSELFWKMYGYKSFRQKTIFDLFVQIVYYTRNEQSHTNSYRLNGNENPHQLASRWAEALKHFLTVVSVEELDSLVKIDKYKRYGNVNSALEYSQAAGIQNEDFLSQLKEGYDQRCDIKIDKSRPVLMYEGNFFASTSREVPCHYLYAEFINGAWMPPRDSCDSWEAKVITWEEFEKLTFAQSN